METAIRIYAINVPMSFFGLFCNFFGFYCLFSIGRDVYIGV